MNNSNLKTFYVLNFRNVMSKLFDMKNRAGKVLKSFLWDIYPSRMGISCWYVAKYFQICLKVDLKKYIKMNFKSCSIHTF